MRTFLFLISLLCCQTLGWGQALSFQCACTLAVDLAPKEANICSTDALELEAKVIGGVDDVNYSYEWAYAADVAAEVGEPIIGATNATLTDASVVGKYFVTIKETDGQIKGVFD